MKNEESKKRIFKSQILDDNSWIEGNDGRCYAVVKTDCGHQHRTYTGALRCLSRLSKRYSDGSHNMWAHYGCVREIIDGLSVPVEDDVE